MSIGGKVTLLNAVVSVIHFYWLSLYKMSSKVRYKIDRIRRKFLWFGGVRYGKKKLHPLLGIKFVQKKNRWVGGSRFATYEQLTSNKMAF